MPQSPIPIQNIFYIFCYAWNRMKEAETIDVSSVGVPTIANLIAKILLDGLRHIRRRAFERGYVSQIGERVGAKGKIQILQSQFYLAQRRANVVCEADEFSLNILSNRILKTTIRLLIRNEEVATSQKNALASCLPWFDGVDLISLSSTVFRQFQIHRNNAYQAFLLQACELAYYATIPDPTGSEFRFIDIFRDENMMSRVFEDFIRNFYRLEQKEFAVTPLEIRWDIADGTENSIALMPRMVVDVHLKRSDRAIIIDTKYYRETLQNYLGRPKLHSHNLYQIFSYLKNVEARGAPYSVAEGLLLYPTTDFEIDHTVCIQGHKIRARTINLDRPWSDISSDLLEIIGVARFDRS